MAQLGEARYLVHGGDWGAAIARELGVIDAEHVIAVHLTMMLSAAARRRDHAPESESESERRSLAAAARYRSELSGYAIEQSTRPQTLSYALTDSPVGQLAWIVEKFKDWTDSETAPEDAVDRDQLLTNVTLYWLTRTAGSSARLYYETAHAAGGWGAPEPPSRTPDRGGGVPARPVGACAADRRALQPDRALDRDGAGRSFPRHGGARAAHRGDLRVLRVAVIVRLLA